MEIIKITNEEIAIHIDNKRTVVIKPKCISILSNKPSSLGKCRNFDYDDLETMHETIGFINRDINHKLLKKDNEIKKYKERYKSLINIIKQNDI